MNPPEHRKPSLLPPEITEDFLQPSELPPDLSTLERNDLSSKGSDVRNVTVETEWLALCYAKRAISYVHKHGLPYGSPNQRYFLERYNTGREAIPRMLAAKISTTILQSVLSQQNPDDPNLKIKKIGAGAAASEHYGAENCDGHGNQTTRWLINNAPSQFTIATVTFNPTFVDHKATMIWWKNDDKDGKKQWCDDPIVCDSWSGEDPCFFSEYWANPSFYRVSSAILEKPYAVLSVAQGTGDKDESRDIANEACDSSKHQWISSLPLPSNIPVITTEEVEQYQSGQGLRTERIAQMADLFSSFGDAVVDEIWQQVPFHIQHYARMYSKETSLAEHLKYSGDYVYRKTIVDPLTGKTNEQKVLLSNIGMYTPEKENLPRTFDGILGVATFTRPQSPQAHERGIRSKDKGKEPIMR